MAFAERPDQFRPLLPQRIARHAPFAGEVAHTKRFLERWCADRSFRAALREDPAAAAGRYGLAADPEILGFIAAIDKAIMESIAENTRDS